MIYSSTFRPFNAFLLSILLTFAFPFTTKAKPICAGLSDGAQKLVADKVSKYEHVFTDSKSKQVFFVGLWSRINEREKRALSNALNKKHDQEMIQGVRDVMSAISSRHSEDRQELVSWVESSDLAAEIEVQAIPVDGSFLLVKATRQGMQAMLCASVAGLLPAIITELSN